MFPTIATYNNGRVARLAGAHNAIGARIAQDTGFDGIWASSLEIATSLGIPDADELTWQQLVAICETIIKSTDLPVLVDCETGFGSPKVVKRVVRAFEDIGAAGICMEDAATPRRNSLLLGMHAVASAREFAAKIRAAVDTRSCMLIVARLQSLVAKRGLTDALERGQRYVDAGADAVVIHSRSALPDEVLDFVSAWKCSVPLVLIPTTYHTITIEQIKALGKVAIVIYANHGVRSAIAAMRESFGRIIADGTSHLIESSIATVAETLALHDKPTRRQHA
jgi:phosphoenolpyruvate phosphomutase